MEEIRNLNEMVNSIGLKLEKSKYGDKSICSVEFFNGKVIEFIDKNNQLYDVLMATKTCGLDKEKVIKSKKLVGAVKNDAVDFVDSVVDKNKSTYVAVVYDLVNGDESLGSYYLFPRKFSDLTVIGLYYNAFLASKTTAKTQK